MHPAKLIERYEHWCDRVLPFDAAARAEKHRRMAASPFAFLRAAYPAWLERFRADPAHAAPEVPLAVGDLHVENFGTWLAPDGEAFGVNDYDETGPAPFTNDLVRLAASAVLAVQAGHLRLSAADIAAHIWSGYAANTLASAGIALSADGGGDAAAVARMWRDARPAAERFWQAIDALPETDAAAPAPAGLMVRTARRRIAGLGSRDRVRLVLDGEAGGARVVYERKPLAPPAAAFAAGAEPRVDGRAYAALLDRQRERSPGLAPPVAVDGPVVVRRLDPDRGRIEIADLPRRRDEHALLRTMGWCTAALHGLSADVAAFPAYLDAHMLEQAAGRMVAVVVADHEQFRRHVAHDGSLRE